MDLILNVTDGFIFVNPRSAHYELAGFEKNLKSAFVDVYSSKYSMNKRSGCVESKLQTCHETTLKVKCVLSTV